jgi:excisionase family DNA binding protein
MTDASRYLTINELADVTGYSVSTLQRLRRKGALPFYQPGGPGTRIVFPADAIERAAKTNQNDAGLPHEAAAAASDFPRRGPRPKWQGTPA